MFGIISLLRNLQLISIASLNLIHQDLTYLVPQVFVIQIKYHTNFLSDLNHSLPISGVRVRPGGRSDARDRGGRREPQRRTEAARLPRQGATQEDKGIILMHYYPNFIKSIYYQG